jgi:hypothetical protein
VRVSPAYIAGFGTAGSLLAGAAVLFVLATGLVGFRGWPTSVGGGSLPRAVVSLNQPPLGGSRPARRLQAGAAADATGAPGAGRRLGGSAAGDGAPSLLSVGRHAAGQGPGGSYSTTGPAGSHGDPVTRPGGPGAGPVPGAPGAGPAPPPCTTDCGSSSAGPLRKVIDTAKHGVQTVAGGAGHVVDQTGKTVGAGVGAATGTVDAGAGHPAGGVVSKVGSAAAGVVSKVGSTAGSVLARVGNAVGS